MPKEVLNREFGDLPSNVRLSVLNLVHEVNADENTYLRPIRVIVECERVPHEQSVHPHSDATGHIEDFPTTGC
jgi:hypothetical protein